MPGRLGTLVDFARDYPVSGDVATLGRRLAETLAPVMLRRTRAAALQGLPPCTIVPDRRVMPPVQRVAYQSEVAAYERSATGVLGLLQQLARVSLHPRIRAELTTAAEADAWAAESARTAALWEALCRYREEGAAVLVFVRSLAMQETLQRALQLSFSLPHVGILNGEVGMSQRHQLVSRLERGTGFRVLLISPKVGGAGWNLQFASRAVLLERPYNPAVEAQMIARIHRLGQTVPVEVLTPVALLPNTRSFDETLDELLRDKRELADSVLAPAQVSDAEVAGRFQSLLDEPTADAGGPDDDMPGAAKPEPPGPGPAGSSPPVAVSPPAGEPVVIRHPLALALQTSERFQQAAAGQPEAMVVRALRAVEVLAAAEGQALSVEAFAEAVGVARRRVVGEVARMGFLNQDTFPVLELDERAGQVRLHLAHVRGLYLNEAGAWR